MTSLLLMLLMSDVEFKPEHEKARVCRFSIGTGYKECSAWMESKEAHERVMKHSSRKDGWIYSYNPQEPKRPHLGCFTPTASQKEGK